MGSAGSFHLLDNAVLDTPDAAWHSQNTLLCHHCNLDCILSLHLDLRLKARHAWLAHASGAVLQVLLQLALVLHHQLKLAKKLAVLVETLNLAPHSRAANSLLMNLQGMIWAEMILILGRQVRHVVCRLNCIVKVNVTVRATV